ncbi:MAG: ankyrin repeat domain-containing protein [Planctomycetes bacterium]|nr:ankyrin repeat domain-containing protein [Planctomycetota bacterium]
MNHSKRELKRRLRRAIRFVESNKLERVAAEIRKYPELRNLRCEYYGSLIQAAWYSNYNSLEFLLNHGIDIETIDYKGETVLIWACAHGRLGPVEFLVSRGANVNVANTDNETPFSFAVAWEHLEVAKLLLENGADINPIHRCGGTPMDAEVGKPKNIEFLKSIGAKRESELNQ